ncbi:MAG: tRNA lysidine(34) synthetase TilS [Proteobacteria bacterium]|nr:tRNA lysidine(34) synthetase TilS [Pseudomonadota bacterium]MBU1583165.1 tRNA lysidine(34) synthetase TilS [Pseudomonadota bacterium]MBU2454073.1 tRNA lysidine(34) synthetase TilS [Pseudomonadota bacterium]
MIDDNFIPPRFIETVSGTICEFNMLEQEASVLAAVSGGPDSVALVLCLLALKDKYAVTIGIAHLNHLLRKEESLRDEAFTKELADRFGLPFHSEQVDVTAYAKTHRLSIEEAGRDVRYRFFNQTCARHGYTKIATGHNKNDTAELMLMNLLRGAGPKGLSGIPPIRDGRYIRPLIRISKQEILEFLSLQNQPYMTDSSNKDTAYLRNKVRNQLVPHLQSEYNPKIIDALARLSTILRQEEDFWDIETKKQLNRCLIKSETASIVLSKPLMSGLHPALLKRVIRKAIKTVKKDLKRISMAHMDDIITFCFQDNSGISLDLPGRIRIYKDTHVITIKKENCPLRELGKKEKQLRRTAQKKQDKPESF